MQKDYQLVKKGCIKHNILWCGGAYTDSTRDKKL